MSTLRVELSGELRRRLTERATAAGVASVGRYVHDLIESDAAPLDEDVEALLLDRMNSATPAIESSPQLWADLRRKVGTQIDRHRAETKE